MKYVVLLGDGMADRPVRELGGRTPLQAAFTPNMDRLAATGIRGMVRTVPKGFGPGSDVANMSIMGYDPRQYYSGRAPLEAASMGIELEPDDAAYRCNLVTLRFEKNEGRAYMEDYSAGHITSEEAAVLIDILDKKLGSREFKFHPGVSYRHLLLWKGGEIKADCTPPHDISGKDISEHLPKGPGSDRLNDLMRGSVDILQRHPINTRRVSAGKNPANSIWLWGQGRKPSFPLFRDKYGIEGAIVSAVDLMRGLGVCAGLKVLKVPGVTGYLDTNYEGKAAYSLNALKELDFVYIHVEAPDEAGHSGKLNDKIQAIEDFDAHVVGNVLKGLKSLGDHRVLLMPDHATPLSIKTHCEDPVPFVIYDSRQPRDNARAVYDETISTLSGALVFEEGHKLMDYFITGSAPEK